ncbi:molybdopterin-dependent oxidoreductase [Peribacillus frigoritolerans]|nr:molybdopterin-dependent oxidoreductase [Peribacillus frigoritolerans]
MKLSLNAQETSVISSNLKYLENNGKKGAISQGKWKGVPLRTLLELSGIGEGAKEVVVEGYDYWP